MNGVQRDYEITVVIDGRERSGRWKLLMGGRVRVTCNWGVDTMTCAPEDRPEAIAGILLEQIITGYASRRAAEIEQARREVEAVNRFWDRQERKPRKPRAGDATPEKG